MKKVGLGIVLLLIIGQSIAQDSINKKDNPARVNGFINIVPNNYNGPLFGSVNLAHGNQKGLQIAIFNWNQTDFSGDHLQLSTLNIVGGSIYNGTQVGFVNICSDSLKGKQVGLINYTKVRNGFQLGFINYSDTVQSGISIGLLSIVRKGYFALEVGVSEMYPINVSFKTGLKNTYSSANFSINNNDPQAPIFGFGFGSLIPIGKLFFLNSDFSGQNGILKSKQTVVSFTTKLSYSLTKKIRISAGPSIVWSHANTAELHQPLYAISNNPINDRNAMVIGFRFTLGYNFKGI